MVVLDEYTHSTLVESSDSFDAVLSSQTLGSAFTIDKMVVVQYDILRVLCVSSLSNIQPVFIFINQRP